MKLTIIIYSYVKNKGGGELTEQQVNISNPKVYESFLMDFRKSRCVMRSGILMAETLF